MVTIRETIDNIPVFYRYSDETQHILNELYRAIEEYNAVITLNQALLLMDFERDLRGVLHTLIEEMYNENLSYGLENDFFIDWVITEGHINDCNIDKEDIQEFKKHQNELKLVEKIKALLSTHRGTTSLQEE